MLHRSDQRIACTYGRNRAIRKLITITALLLASTIAPAQSCTATSLNQAVSTTLGLQAQLLAASVPFMDTEVPAPLKPLLHNFKQDLIATVDLGLRCNNPEPVAVQANLAALLHANRPRKPQQKYAPAKPPSVDTGTYGDDLTIAVKKVPGQSNLFSLQLNYSIECGDDSILLVYRRTPAGWQRALVWSNFDLNTTGDAFGNIFFFAPVPAPQPAFVIVHGAPWCTSNSSMFYADLVALAQTSIPQHLLDHIDHDYRLDWPAHFRPEPEGFELVTTVDSISGDLVFAPAVLRYSTISGHMVQQPVAANARSFVDLWLRSSWPVVANWSEPHNSPRLKATHDELGGDSSFLNFGPVLACSSNPNHFQVELDLEADQATPDLQIINLPKRYAQIRANPNSFTLLEITKKHDPTCHGPDIMKHR